MSQPDEAMEKIMLGAARHIPEELDAPRYLAHVKFLASEAMRGRATGSPELEKAAAYIARQFKTDGLQPLRAFLCLPGVFADAGRVPHRPLSPARRRLECLHRRRAP